MSSIEAVYQAIAILNGSDGAACRKACTWLGEFQKPMFTWFVCNHILTERRDPKASCFAAQTMRQKLLRPMKKLPTSLHLSLKESLINHLKNYEPYHIEENSVIITQLCLTLVDLYLLSPEWTGFVTEMVALFSKPDKIPVLLALLKTLPEEVQSAQLKVEEDRRHEINVEMAEKTETVTYLLSQICISNGDDDDILKRVLSCFSSWLINPLIPTDAIATSDLLKYIFELQQNPNSTKSLHESACECMVSAFSRVADTKIHHSLALALQTACYEMAGSFSMAAANNDLDRLKGYGRVFCELNELLLERMIEEPGQDFGDFRSIEMLLLLASYHHHHGLVEMTFNIWYRLSEYLSDGDDEELIGQFKPYIERFIMALYKHCHFNDDQKDIPDGSDDFMAFRAQVSDTLQDIIPIVGKERCTQIILSMLQSVPSTSWTESEAALYIISAILTSLLPTEQRVAPKVFQAVMDLPSTSHLILMDTSIKLLGNLTTWLDENKQYQKQCIKWLMDKARMPPYIQASSQALQRIREKCSPEIL